MAKTNVVSDKWESSLARNEVNFANDSISISYGQLVKLALETGHFCYRLIIALTLSHNLRRRSAIRSNREKVAGLTRSGSANARKSFSI